MLELVAWAFLAHVFSMAERNTDYYANLGEKIRPICWAMKHVTVLVHQWHSFVAVNGYSRQFSIRALERLMISRGMFVLTASELAAVCAVHSSAMSGKSRDERRTGHIQLKSQAQRL